MAAEIDYLKYKADARGEPPAGCILTRIGNIQAGDGGCWSPFVFEFANQCYCGGLSETDSIRAVLITAPVFSCPDAALKADAHYARVAAA